MIFNFFKNKDKEYAEQTYSMFAPPIKFAKEYGDWKKSSKTFGELLVFTFIHFTFKILLKALPPNRSNIPDNKNMKRI